MTIPRIFTETDNQKLTIRNRVYRMSDDKTGIDPKLLEILVCPLTKGKLTYDRDAQELVSDQAQLAYPIRDGIPIMLVDEARQLDAAS